MSLKTLQNLDRTETQKGKDMMYPVAKQKSPQTIHGTFTLPGDPTRPFIHTTTPLSITRSFSTILVTSHQPAVPSTNPANDFFPAEDASLPLSKESCFQATLSFKSPFPPRLSSSTSSSSTTTIDEQTPPVQTRFSHILLARKPEEWPLCPSADIDIFVNMARERDAENPATSSTFPAVEMRKVAMSELHNRGRALHERTELVIYRLREDGSHALPLEDEEAHHHALLHAYAVDRNGLLMLANNVGLGEGGLEAAGTLAWTFVLHVSPAGCKFGGGAGAGYCRDAPRNHHNPKKAVAWREYATNGWWVQEITFPRVGSGRGVVMSKVWSPWGVHVATMYQDGSVRGNRPWDGAEGERVGGKL